MADDVENLKADLAELEFAEADFDGWEEAAIAGVDEVLERTGDAELRKRGRALLNRLPVQRLVARRVYAKYRDDVGRRNVGDWQSFFEWILAHQEEIAAFIKLIISLFNPPVPTV